MTKRSNYGSINTCSPKKNDEKLATTPPSALVFLEHHNDQRRDENPIIKNWLQYVLIGAAVTVLYLAAGGVARTNTSASLVATVRAGETKDQKKKGTNHETNLHFSNTPRFFEQELDHFDPNNHAKWMHRYYAKEKYWKGPGHPILLEVGGEAGNDIGLFYGFIDRVLAKKFGAYVLHPEHRFYGKYLPLKNATVPQLVQLLTPEQAMQDMLAIVKHYRGKLGCSHDKASKHYCPVITVGGSYPGFLAAMLRFLYPDQVDIGYGSSAPLKLYSKQADPDRYFEIVTEAAEGSSAGCAQATRQTLLQAQEITRNAPDFEALAYDKLNICPGSIPAYINSSALFSQEILIIIESSFADANMIGNYPPSNHSWLANLCHVFQDENGADPLDKIAKFWKHLEVQDPSVDCFVMDFQLSDGDHAQLSGADWSGSGPGSDGRMWDFQCCLQLIPELSFSDKSMFPRRDFSWQWLKDYCIMRYGVVGDPLGLVKQWHFDDLVANNASRLLFTNGENDMWFAGSVTEDLSDSILAINIPGGAHHSEVYALKNDTAPVKKAQKKVTKILTAWLRDIANGT